ncbi:hypothetical protein CEB3_c12340 [Peptococcaceae bacterium CEB3]|nr:hypothetical protein CEB3_c12340 [Peptococcaceae bacterium CEB3]
MDNTLKVIVVMVMVLLTTKSFMVIARGKRQSLVLALAFVLTGSLMVSGCSATVRPTSVSNAGNSLSLAGRESGSVDNVKGEGVAGIHDMQANPLFRMTLTLPNGQIVTRDHPVTWKDILIWLQIPSLPTQSPRYAEILGNHSTVLSHSTVSTSAGPATLVLNKRTPPAAAQSTTPTYEYWVIAYRSQYAYAIEATVIGDRLKAKNEVMELVRNWQVPQ